MHPTNKNTLVKLGFGILTVVLAVLGSDSAYCQSPWMGYTPAQKQLAVAGFTDCYRSQSSDKKAYAGRNLAATVRLIDAAAKSGDLPLPSLIIQSIQKAPVVKPDPHGEHWSGPTGFHSGLWWRGIEDGERQAYVQGIVWCSQAPQVSAQMSDTSSQAVVSKLNDWYVISDDDWKDPRSNARVDVPVISALQKIEILHIKGAAAKR